MYVGRVVETGQSELLYEHPRHPYTAALLSAVPRPETNGTGGRRQRIVLGGDVPSPVAPPPALRLPPALPALRARALRRRDAGAAALRRRPRGRLPLPGRAVADDRGGAPNKRSRPSRRPRSAGSN